jgi:ornithine cyclodeaminase/alanine dehydrogenase-like protein (mu-crystallin family)
MESGDLLLAWHEEDWRTPRLVELKDVVAGRARRQSPADVTIFKSNGLGIEDIAVAALVYERARSEGAGEDLTLMGL